MGEGEPNKRVLFAVFMIPVFFPKLPHVSGKCDAKTFVTSNSNIIVLFSSVLGLTMKQYVYE